MDYPQTVGQARDHIGDIRRAKGLEGSQNNLKDLEAALLSEQLYQKSTHFLLELIQNADDNSYSHNSPSVDIRYKDRFLLVSCNEDGFSRSNVDAICRIGRSTKARQHQASGYIGEKGIGFKSVFKVADVVWIKSGNYSFKFDKSQTLGMIAPIWDEFPRDLGVKLDHTNILLRLADSYNENELIREIESLDPRLLLFLRKLKEVRVSISIRDGTDSETAIKRSDQDDGSGLRYVTLSKGGTYQRYLVASYIAQDLAQDSKRPGYTESELVLGFPVGFDNSPILTSQNVHAFLPIRDYGFKYLIQADLLLIASREDIDNSSAWNLSLLRAIPSAMLSAVVEFNRGRLKYSWLSFLRRRTPMEDLFSGLEDKIEAFLSQHPILETASRKWARPGDLFQVPTRFCDTNGSPLLLSSATTHQYLSSGYGNEDWNILKRLGVRQQTTEMFLDDLAHLVEHLPAEFRSRPDSWHTSLSEALSTILNLNKPLYRRKIMGMAIIPVKDGRWVPPVTDNVFFEANAPTLNVPPGIEVLLVDRSVNHDSVRVRLLAQLGVKRFSLLHACVLIARMHANPSFHQLGLKPSHLVSQVQFLYHAAWTNPEGRDIYFVGRDGEVAHGNKFYVDSTHPFAATSWPSRFRSKVRFLHADYLPGKSDPHESEQWTAWLAERCGLNIFPILVTAGPGSCFELSEDFRLLMRVSDAGQILRLFRAQWSLYSKWIDMEFSLHDGEEQNSFRSALVDELGLMKVRCKDGTVAPLRETFLPLSDLPPRLAAQLRLLDIEDPDSSAWHFLKHLGVGITFDNRVFIDQLRAVQGTDIPVQDVAKLYRELDSRGPAPEEAIFKKEDLIYIPPSTRGSRGAWVNSTRCIWDGHWSLRRTACLKRYYPYLQPFFHRTLRINNSDLSTLVTEASMISPSDPLDYIAELFISISRHLTMSLVVQELELVRGLKQSRIFPIRKKGTPISAPFDELQAVTEKNVWLIADRPHLQQCFERRIDILAFDAKDVGQMLRFLNELGISRRLLSGVASSLVEIEGGAKLLKDYTSLMRSKAALIASLIHTTNTGQEDKQALYRSLRSLEVFLVDRVVLRWTLRTADGTEVAGSPESGRIKTSNEDGKFGIYLTSADADPAEPPPELVEELLKLCGIKDAMLLQQVLMRSNIPSLTEMLSRRGFTVEVFDKTSSKEAGNLGAASFLVNLKEQTKQKEKQAQSTEKDDLDKANKLEDFIRGIDRAASVENILNRRWGETQAKPLLSRVCRLDGQNAALFLPVQDVVGAQERGRGLPDEPTEWSFEKWDKADSAWKRKQEGVDIMFEALYLPYRKGGAKVYIFNRNVNNVSEEVAFLGELTISRLLEFHLKKNYSPLENWTSILRTRAGLPPYDPGDEAVSSFTVVDARFVFTEFLSQHGYKDAMPKGTGRIATYHLEVVTTEGTLEDSKFYLRGYQIAKNLSFTSVEYRYKPLKGFRDVRLFELFPENEGNSLRGAIKEMPLDSCGRYRALSYRWGSELKPYHIETEQGLLPVTASLYAALKRLESPSQSVMLWVDAICIDQQNKKEKVVQLRLMREIYEKATRVCAWIGDESGNSHQAIKTLIQITTADRAPKPWPASLPRIPESWTDQKCPPENDPIWCDIDTLFEREWFTRAWILQEVILAADVDVYCGQWHVSWDDLFHALTICVKANSRYLEERLSGRRIPLAAYTVGLTRQLYRNRPLARKNTLLELLELFSYTSATIKIDKLFALLHLASDGDEVPFRPDYISPPEVVIRRYADAFVARGSTLHLLYRAGTSKAFPFCSWIPDWTRKDHPKSISTWYGTKGRFSASGKTQLRASVSVVDKQILTVSVTFVDRIARVGDVTLWDSDTMAFLNHLHEQLIAVVPYPTGESLEDLKFLLPCGGASRPHLDPFTDAMAAYHIMAKGVQDLPESNGDADSDDVFDRSEVTRDIKSIDHLVRFLKSPGSTRKNVRYT
ncbi:Heterokaryon incompatibility protein 6, OR allele [Madurella mycetomatis]|uniref:Heterokaryon incompatibility protein 6, OR allele n=1 Tax=Madurella mycetomatis TaxID=100816 RepID=A0A175W3W3_9PEZI|nr:Heterokaryon incompatibility protein 6, OR allele [Madurella mycetomatis]